ncbi:MAG: hypothetical protein FJ405_12030, partial [Verrucomicrobia bacterium]|nr:hypothetical protein [Verrucomicrobiota bacterium]
MQLNVMSCSSRSPDSPHPHTCLLTLLTWISISLSPWIHPARSHAAPFISEFLADNASGILDADRDHSDWIEIANPDAHPVDMTGWRLTDDPQQTSKWIFPSGVRIPGGGRLIVFASGKNRRNPTQELHTGFSLRKEGEYLGLYPPNQPGASSEFSPAYPPQLTDVSFGVGFESATPPPVPLGAPARIRIHPQGGTALDWTGHPSKEPFPDSGWIQGFSSVGYDDPTNEVARPLLAYWGFNEIGEGGKAMDGSGRNNHGTPISPASHTVFGGGRTGRSGDRAMDFGSGGKGASVRIPTAESGAFDLLRQLDQATVSLWAWGGPQLPANNTVIWFDSGSPAGDSRNFMVHLPWSDSVIYFDTAGCCGGDTRIARQELDSSKWKGRWNHYVFVKNRSRKEIWQNGTLWHSGEGASPLNNIQSLWLGSAPQGAVSYPGKLDDVAIWAGALSANNIQALASGLSPLLVGTYRQFILTDLSPTMRGVSATAQIRIPFLLPQATSTPEAWRLRVRYDDGFVAWLNGELLVSRNVSPTQSRPRIEGSLIELMDLVQTHRSILPGSNILAFELQNDSASGSDLLLTAELEAGSQKPARFFTHPTPNQANDSGVAGFVTAPDINPKRGFYDDPIRVTLFGLTPGASIRYTLDGSAPSATQGFLVEPSVQGGTSQTSLVISNSTVLRALCFREDFQASAIQTHTYLFASQVDKQPQRPSGFPATWGVYGAYGPLQGQPVPADYEMDPRINRTPAPGYSVKDGILSLPAVCLTTSVSNLFDAATGIYPNSAAQGGQWIRPASVEMFSPRGETLFQIDAGLRIHGGLSRQHWHARKHSFRVQFRPEFGPTRLQARLFDDTRVTSFNELTLRASSTDGWSVEDASPWTRPKATYLRDPWMK